MRPKKEGDLPERKIKQKGGGEKYAEIQFP
jgi:hypothetical protein